MKRGASKSTFTNLPALPRFRHVEENSVTIDFARAVGGCAATFTNLTPKQQSRNANNFYPVEVALTSRQQTLQWNSINPQVIVGTESYPMRPTLLMTNRWEGLIPVGQGTNAVHYHYKFDYQTAGFGKAIPDSASSPEYTLRITDQ